MRYKNYSYDLTQTGIVITGYFPDMDTAEPEGISEPDRMEQVIRAEAHMTAQETPAGEETSAFDEPEAGESVRDGLPGLSLSIPSHIDGFPVTEIGREAFAENGEQIGRIEVPSTVRRIGNGAFRMCISLTELILSDGLEWIGGDAFFLTPMEELTLPATLKVIENPWELSTVRFHVATGNPYFFTDEFCLYRREGSETELLTARQTEERTEYEIPDGTTVIGENALSGNAALRRVILPSSVHTIGEAAFEGCQNLSEVILREGVCDIQANAFSHCICLRQLHLPASVEKIGCRALSDTFGWSEELRGLECITVADGNAHFMADADALFEIGKDKDRYLVKYFGRGREYRIPGDVSRILPEAFRRTALRSCFFPVSVKDVGTDAFRECKELERLELEETGAVIYVPVQPVYRKDEVVGLFYSREAEMTREASNYAFDPFAMPEKWNIFAYTDPSHEKQMSRSDPFEGYIYDYRGYDALFDTYLNLLDRCGMACCRLKYPIFLNADSADRYRSFVADRLMDILQCIQKSQDMERLAQLADLGFFTEDNIEESLEIFGRVGQAKFTGFLLNYKKEHLQDSKFDFSI